MGQFDLSALLAKLPAPADPDLLVGNRHADDAAVYRIGQGQVMVQTVDFFTPVVDDPWIFGQIAAANALSDVYAMGARPVLALALAAFPTGELPTEVLEAILRGGAEKVAEAGAVIGGGHSIDHDIPLYGLCVTGLAAESAIVTNARSRTGDVLVLTKPLGVGVTISAGRADALGAASVSRFFRRPVLADDGLDEAVAVMSALNRGPAEAMKGLDVHAATDVTGYGLLGHAYEMMDASGVTGEFFVEEVPLLSRARDLAARGIAPEGSRVNLRNMRPRTEVGEGVTDEDLLLLCDAQTSGGLLVSVAASDAPSYVERCRAAGAPSARVVGRVVDAGKSRLRVSAKNS
ncbi:MAG: selenide, water dikinase SelD [Acidobacteria bacterium]|nr:selenide, water dikinase SelD [Acidobacteriota bacterium]MCA1610226.1 selenide, water dikinase SelD [Acidobacteriota bacterium]